MSTPEEPLRDPLGRAISRPCPRCAQRVALDAPFCPHCGVTLVARNRWAPLLAAGAVAVLVGIVLALVV